jgi:MFS family permease
MLIALWAAIVLVLALMVAHAPPFGRMRAAVGRASPLLGRIARDPERVAFCLGVLASLAGLAPSIWLGLELHGPARVLSAIGDGCAGVGAGAIGVAAFEVVTLWRPWRRS